jgi:hypothetical protein
MKAASNTERAGDLDDDSSDGRNSGGIVEPTTTPQQLSSKVLEGLEKVISPCSIPDKATIHCTIGSTMAKSTRRLEANKF